MRCGGADKKEGLYQKKLRIEVDTDSLFYGA